MAINGRLLFFVVLVSVCVLERSCVRGARLTVEYHHQIGSTNQHQVSELVHNSIFRENSATSNPDVEFDESRPIRSLNSITPATVEVAAANAFGADISLPLIPVASGVNFIVKLGFGTPAKDFTLLFDTGSDITWIPCKTNNQQQGPIVFDPASSSTFSNATCPDGCDHKAAYRDGSSATVHYVKDTLTIDSNLMFPDFVFGCAQTVKGDFAGASGVLGLDQGTLSLARQTDGSLLAVLCYCLPAVDSSNGYLVFGVQAFETCVPDNTTMISLTPNKDPNGLAPYFVMLNGITIGSTKLDFSQSLNTNLDSGTTVSSLPSPVYARLRAAFKELMSQYTPVEARTPLDTCYKVMGSWQPPRLVLHFDGGIDVNLHASAAITRDPDSVVCLAFAGDSDPNAFTIIGNQQQRGKTVFYDINSSKLSFGSATC